MRIKYNFIKLRRFYCQFNTMSMKNTLLTIGCGLFLLAACNPKPAADTTLSGLKNLILIRWYPVSKLPYTN